MVRRGSEARLELTLVTLKAENGHYEMHVLIGLALKVRVTDWNGFGTKLLGSHWGGKRLVVQARLVLTELLIQG